MKTRIFVTLLPVAVLGCNLTLGLGDYALEEGALCQDGIKNQDETGIDCGGACLACADNQGCMVGTDCASLVCEGNLCRPPSCNDGIQNGDELGVDCRGTCIDQKCKAGEACNSGIDCIGGECNTNNICEATCTDNTQNGLETGLDCGGGQCGACANGLGCSLNSDCESEVCSESFCVDYHRFSYGFGEVYSTQFFASTMMVDSKSDDRIAVGGSFIGSFDFGKGFEVTVENVDLSNVYLAQFDGSGKCLWSNSFGDTTYPQIASAISVNANGDMAVTGLLLGTINFGSGILQGDTIKSNAFVAVFNSMGQSVWSRSIGGTFDDRGTAVSINAAGEVLATGYFAGTNVNMGGQIISSNGNATDIYLVRYQNNGTALWAKSFGDAAVQYEPLLAENTSGTTILAGKLNGSMDFGGGALQANMDAAIQNIYIAALNKQGSHLWSKSYSHTVPGKLFGIADVAIDENNNTTIVGSFSASIQLDTKNLSSKGELDIFVAQFDPNGKLLWANAYGNTDFDEAKNLDITPDGSLLITGTFANTIDFGGHTLNAAGNGSAFLLKLSPTGKHIWSHALGNNKNIAFPDISPQGNHNQNIVSTSVYSGSLNYGGPQLPAPAMGLSFALAGLTLPLQ